MAWDVGIQHLAYCIIEVNYDTKKFKILDWKNLDLTEEDKFQCSCKLKKKNKKDTIEVNCTSPAKFYTTIDNQTTYYCGAHKKQYKTNKDEINEKYVKDYENLNKDKCQFTSKKECKSVGKFLFDNLICCKVHKESLLKQKIKDLSLKSIKKNKCTSTDPQMLCYRMYKKFNEFEIFKNVDEVYIENQPSFKNPTMKAVSSMLFSYFVNLFMNQDQIQNKKVKFVSPSFKINITKELYQIIENKKIKHDQDNLNNKVQFRGKNKDKCACRLCALVDELEKNKTKFGEKYDKYKLSSYQAVKEIGIIYTEKILNDNGINDALKLIEQYNKKDDVCDAFLHAYRKVIF